MDRPTVNRLVELNRTFYETFSASFATSRSAPQPGFARLMPYLTAPEPRVLDVGCGDGRLGAFLAMHHGRIDYSGVDFAGPLLELARARAIGRVFACDLSQAGCLDRAGQYDLIACLSTLQHIPGRDNRERLLTEVGRCLQPDGSLVLANWQFLNSERMKRKIVPWSKAEVAPDDLEAGDYLLSWQRDGYGLRYVAYIDAAETARLAAAAGLRIVNQFFSDGREGDLNLYTVMVC